VFREIDEGYGAAFGNECFDLVGSSAATP